MSFFKKIKEFFSEDFDEGAKELTLNELESLINEHSRSAFNTSNEKIKEIGEAIALEKSQLLTNLSKLEQAELRNNDIPSRVKQIMHGNREAYVQKMNSLSGQINVPFDFTGLLSFTNDFQRKLSEFEKSVAKNHQVMLEFFVKETTAVSTNIRNIDKHVKEIKQTMESNNIFRLDELKQKTKSLQNKIRQKEEIENEMAKIKEELGLREKEIENKEQRIESLKMSEEYDEFVSLTEEKERTSLDLTNLRSQLLHAFSEIETALKKFSNSHPEDKLLKCYLDDPLNTLLEDNSIEIARILRKVRNSVEINEIELKEKKKEKTISELEKLSEHYFRDFLQTQRELTRNLQTLSKKIEDSLVNKEIKKLKNEAKQNREKLAEDTIPLKKLEKDLKEIEISSMKSEIEDEIIKNLNRQIKISPLFSERLI